MITVCDLTIRQDCDEAMQLLEEMLSSLCSTACAPLLNVLGSTIVADHVSRCKDCREKFEVPGAWRQEDVKHMIHVATEKVRRG